jgi:tungstate transport system ATP-binding protein
MPLYELNNIRHSYNGRPVLSIDDWCIAADSVTGVVGPNGSGKSTLLSLLGFVETPTRGAIRFKGRLAEPFADSVRGKVAMLPQDSFLLKRTVYSNIAYGLKVASNQNKNERSRVHAAMAMVGLDPRGFGRRPWFALSGGEARRVALAARLVLQPEVLLLDEPTTSVDAASAQMIKEAAQHARRQWGTTLIVTSHDADWLADISDTIVHLFRGRILGNGRQTLIFGPWQATGKGIVKKALTEDQWVEAHGEPSDMLTAVAAIEARQMGLYLWPEQIPANRHRLKGLLLRLNYEQSTRCISAAVLVGGTVFNAYLPEFEEDIGRFSPGGNVWVGYDPEKVVWY